MASYKTSSTVKSRKTALNTTKKMKPSAYESSWQAQLDAAMDRILNREAFSYDMKGDALYRQYKDQAIRGGQLAMMDAMGQAAAMTGGYGSSYAQSVSQQAYQQQLQSLNEMVPELYALALEQYDRQGQALADNYSLLSDREQQDYGRYLDSVSSWESDYQRAWEAYQAALSFDYNKYRDTVSDSQWKKELSQQKSLKQKELALEKKRLAEEQRQFNTRLTVLGK